MLSFSGALRIFIALDPCDMRAGINTLHALVSGRLQEEVKNGARFVFTNKRRRLLKVLYWDGTGCWLLTKRLEAGTFYWPRAAADGQTKLAQSLAGQALTYALGQWDKLLVFLQDGRVQIDNNLAENTIRPTAIGKKNWLFIGDPKSGGRAAVFYTLIGNCHRAGIDAQAYLTDLFTRLPLPTETTKTLRSLTPQGWAAARKAAAESPQA
jgi:hypothetical protein